MARANYVQFSRYIEMAGSTNRKLAAIMFTDIVGYSSLMHKDENLGFELLHEHRAIVRRHLQNWRGIEIDTVGDGFVAKFNSAVDAVKCGLDIQSEFRERNTHQPKERQILLRIGIHVGDILESGHDSKHGVYGDGVNIAARLQPFSPPGGLCISSAVLYQVRSHIDTAVTPIGRPKLKGITRPIRLYTIHSEWSLSGWLHKFKMATVAFRALVAIFCVALLAGVYVQAHKNPVRDADLRVAVMPFDSTGLDESENFIPDGLIGSVISTLSKNGLHVLAKNSVMVLKASHRSPREIGEELGIDRLITGTLSKAGGKLHVSISMVNTSSQEVLWTQDFQTAASDLLKMTESISSSIGNQFYSSRKLASLPSKLENSSSADQKEAYTAYLKAQFHTARRSP